MSMWGMNDGALLTGKHLWTNGDATLGDGGTGTNATYIVDKVQDGDVLVGADSKLYRVRSVTSATALEVDRVYEGSTADDEDVMRIKLPRHIKITNDAGVGLTLAQLGIFGFSDAEAMAGGDDVVSLTNKNNTYSGVGGSTTQGGAGYTSAPTVTIAQPTARAFDAESASVVILASDAIVLSNPPATGTQLRYYNFPGGSYSAVSGSTSGTVITGITNNQVQYARTANSTAIYLYSSFANATANNGIGKPSTGLRSLSAVSGTAGNHTLVGVTATTTAAIATGRVSGYTMTVAGSDYTSAPTATVATQTATFNSASPGVAANGMITTSAAHGLIVGDRVQYNRNSQTALTELTDLSYYYVVTLGSTTTLQLGATKAGAIIALTAGSGNQTLIGEAATATSALGAGRAGVGTGRQRDMMGAHTGWVKRTVGTGGRAGRVHYETLVAASSITGDGEDLATPDE